MPRNLEPPTTVTDPEKRQAILDACFELFAERGFAGTDVEEVAQLASVGKGTVYRYFGNKEQLFTAVVEEITHRAMGRYTIDDIADVNLETALSAEAAGSACATPSPLKNRL